MSYKFMISHNCGISYHEEHSSDDKEDPKFKQLADYCEKHVKRYYIEDNSGKIADVSGLHKAAIAIFDFGISTPYREKRTMDEKLEALRSHFKCKAR